MVLYINHVECQDGSNDMSYAALKRNFEVQNTSKHSFWTVISGFYGDFEKKQVRTLIKLIFFLNSPPGEYIFQLFKAILKKNR